MPLLSPFKIPELLVEALECRVRLRFRLLYEEVTLFCRLVWREMCVSPDIEEIFRFRVGVINESGGGRSPVSDAVIVEESVSDGGRIWESPIH